MKSACIQDRLRSVMQQKNLRQVDVIRLSQPYCREYGVKLTKTDLTQYLSGKTKPNEEKLFILAVTLGVCEAWLLGYDVCCIASNDTEDRAVTPENKILTIAKEKEQEDMAKKTKELVFDKKQFADARNIRVRIEDDCVEIVNDIWLQTGLSATKIVSEMIRFANQHVVLRTPMCFADDEDE